MNRIDIGNCIDLMKQYAEDGVKVQCCVTSPPYYGLRSYLNSESDDKHLEIGLEQSPDEYIEKMVEVFRGVKEILADDGILWVNIGDSYAANRTYQVPSTKGGNKHSDSQAVGGKGSKVPDGLKPKDLIGIPWMLAFALRKDGWYLRQDIIWHKPNPMPESVRDRCTKAHEYVFLLSKSEKYFFDSESVKELAKHPNAVAQWTSESRKERAKSLGRLPVGNEANGKKYEGNETRNRRSVWTVTTKPYKGAHFATFPPDLIEPCILAGSKEGDIIFDPFMGSGTTAGVALAHNRQYLGCDLNPEYQHLHSDRIKQVVEYINKKQKEESKQSKKESGLDTLFE